MIIRDTGGEFKSVDPGTHVARCISLVGIGTREKEWKGKKRLASEIVIAWELPFELMDDGRPYTISAFYTRSLADKANLRHALKNWRGRDFTAEELRAFELRNVLDKGCQVVCAENERQRVQVTSVAGLPKGVELPDRVNDLRYFDAEEFDMDAYELLSDGMKKLVNESFEYKEFTTTGSVMDANERHLQWQSNQGTPTHTGNGTAAQMAPAIDEEEVIPF